MSTYTQVIYQIVFSTKNREHTLTKSSRDILFKYIWGILQNKKCHLYRINGVEDHIHIMISLHPTVALSSLVKEIKISSTLFIKENQVFENFSGWQNGYGAFTYSIKEKDLLIQYIKNQEAHHRVITFEQEYMDLLREHGIVFDIRYLF